MLGAIEVLERGEVIPLSRGKERALLAVLLLRANQVVSVDQLVTDLWPDEPPTQAAKTVQVYVSRLRQRLGDQAILTRSPGYTIPLDSDQLDLSRFERLVASARDLPPDDASDRLREALALFRGPVLADVAYEPFAQGEIARIEELRLEALEARIAADLGRGRHAGLVPELESLVRSHPLRERLRAQLALALYRAGRQADALEVVREGRRKLVDELGLEPAEELKVLERAILAHDPELEPPGPDTPEGAVLQRPTRRRSRRALLGAAAAGAVLVGAALVAVLARGSDENPILAPPGSVALIDPGRNAVTAAIDLPERPSRIAVQGDDVWILHPDAATLTRVSRSERIVSRSLGLGGAPGSIAAEDGAVWVSDVLAGTVTRIDAERPDVRRTFAARPGPAGLLHSDAGALAFGFGSLWFASGRRTVTRVDTEKLVSRGAVRDVGTAGPSIGGIATAAGAVWVAALHELTRIDPRSNTVEAVVGPLSVFRIAGLAASAEGAWLSDVGSDQVLLVDAAQTQVAGATKVGSQPLGVAYGAGAIWVANSGDGTVTRIDPTTGRVVATISVGGSPTGIAATDDEVWVTVA